MRKGFRKFLGGVLSAVMTASALLSPASPIISDLFADDVDNTLLEIIDKVHLYAGISDTRSIDAESDNPVTFGGWDQSLAIGFDFKSPLTTDVLGKYEGNIYRYDLSSIEIDGTGMPGVVRANGIEWTAITDNSYNPPKTVGRYQVVNQGDYDNPQWVLEVDFTAAVDGDITVSNAFVNFEATIVADKLGDEGGDKILLISPDPDDPRNPSIKVKESESVDPGLHATKDSTSVNLDDMTVTYVISMVNDSDNQIDNTINITDKPDSRWFDISGAQRLNAVVLSGVDFDPGTVDFNSYEEADIVFAPGSSDIAISYGGGFDPGDRLVIEYTVPLKDAVLNVGTDSYVNNTITAKIENYGSSGSERDLRINPNGTTSITERTHIDKKLLQKTGSVVDADAGLVEWTININNGSTPYDIAGLTINDNLQQDGCTQGYAGDYTIYYSDGSVYHTGTIADGATSFSYTFPDDQEITDSFVLKYQTVVSDYSGQTEVNNTASIGSSSEGNILTVSGDNGVGEPVIITAHVISKEVDESRTTIERNRATIGWTTGIDIPYNNFVSTEPLVITDTLKLYDTSTGLEVEIGNYNYNPSNFYFIQDSFLLKVGGETVTPSDPSETRWDYTPPVVLQFDSYSYSYTLTFSYDYVYAHQGEHIEISYQTVTVVDDISDVSNSHYKVHNDVSMSGCLNDNVFADKYVDRNVDTTDSYLRKEITGNLDSQNLTTWTLTVNDPSSVQAYWDTDSMEITETLENCHIYDQGDRTITVEVIQGWSTILTLTIAYDKLTVSDDGHSVSFNLSDAVTDADWWGSIRSIDEITVTPDVKINFIYKTEIDADYLAGIDHYIQGETNASYSNTAILTGRASDNGSDYVDVSSTPETVTDTTSVKVLDKVVLTQTNDDKNNGIVSFSVTVNPNGTQISASGTGYLLTDYIPAGLDYVDDSLAVSSNGSPLSLDTASNHSVDSDHYEFRIDSEANTLSIWLPDNIPVTITYSLYYYKSGTVVNEVEIPDTYAIHRSYTSTSRYLEYMSSSSGADSSYSISLHKVSSIALSADVAGAVFSLTEYAYSEGEYQYSNKITETTNSSGMITFSGLNRNSLYVIEEVSAPEGYVTSDMRIVFCYPKDGDVRDAANRFATAEELPSVRFITPEHSFQVTNAPDTNTLYVSKIFRDGNGDNLTVTDAVSFVLTDPNGDSVALERIGTTGQLYGLVDHVFSVDGTYTIHETSETRPGFKPAETVTFEVSERKIVAGSASGDALVSQNFSSGELTVGFLNEQYQNRISFGKIYHDANGNVIVPSEAATFRVFRDFRGADQRNYSDRITADGNTYTISNLPAGTYTIVETSPLGFEPVDNVVFTVDEDLYIRSITGGNNITGLNTREDASFELVNTQYENELVITKVYTDQAGNTVSEPSSRAVFTLYNEDGSEAAVQPVYSSSEDSYTYTLSNLQTGSYILRETSAPDGYDQAEDVSITVDGALAITEVTGGVRSASASGENLYSWSAVVYNRMESVTLTGTKTWTGDGDFADDYRKEPVLLVESSNDDGLTWDTVGADSYTVTWSSTDSDIWSYEITDLPKIDQAGVTLRYRVTEKVAVNGYIASGVNSLVNTFDTVSIAVTKIWNDGNDRDGKRPSSLTVKLYMNDVLIDTVELTADQWSHTFEGLPRVDTTGNFITYKVVEVLPDGSEYTVSQGEDSATTSTADSYNLSLKNDYSYETTSITAMKIWEDDNNRDALRPQSITVTLYAGTDPIGSETLDASSRWQCTWNDLPVRDENGSEIDYRVEESNFADSDRYTATSDPIDSSGIIRIYNTHEIETINITASKVWADNSDEYGIRPDSVTVNLLADGTVADTATADSSNSWTVHFNDLPVCSSGREIVYEIAEVEPANYLSSVSSPVIDFDGNRIYEITNTINLGGISFIKYGRFLEEDDADYEDSALPLQGAQFELSSTEDFASVTATAVSGSDGKVLFENLSDGLYYIRESFAPDGYEIDDTVYMAQLENGLQVSFAAGGGEIADRIVTNDVTTGEIRFRKVNENDETMPVGGSRYGLYRTGATPYNPAGGSTQVLIATGITDDDGYISFRGVLTNVEYTIRELEAPEGYYASTNSVVLKLIVDAQSGQMQITSADTGDGTITVLPDGSVTWLEPEIIVRVDKLSDSGNPLAGATLAIVDADSEDILETWVTDGSTHTVEAALISGHSYILRELAAPDGYDKAADRSFTVEAEMAPSSDDSIIELEMIDVKTEEVTTSSQVVTSSQATTGSEVTTSTETDVSTTNPTEDTTSQSFTSSATNQDESVSTTGEERNPVVGAAVIMIAVSSIMVVCLVISNRETSGKRKIRKSPKSI